jgi:hypothetical protein
MRDGEVWGTIRLRAGKVEGLQASAASAWPAAAPQAQLLADSPQPSNRFTQRLNVPGRDKAGSPFKHGNTEPVVHVRSVDDPRETLIEEQSCQDLRHDPVLATKKRDVQALKPMRQEDAGMFHLQPVPHLEIVEPYKLSRGDLDERGRQSPLFPKLPVQLPCCRAVIAEQLFESLEILQVRAEGCQNLAQTGQPGPRAVERAKPPLRIIEAVAPGIAGKRRELQGTGDMPEPPDLGAVLQGTVSTNAFAAVTTNPQSSGTVPSRSTDAGAWPSNWLFRPKNQA